jgi:hypothetical protein
VDPYNGRSGNDGSSLMPLLRVEDALAVARAAAGSAEIVLRAGAPHYLEGALVVDGAFAEKPLTITGDGGAWLSGGYRIPSACWSLVVYTHPVYATVWAAATTAFSEGGVELRPTRDTENVFLWRCDLGAALGDRAPEAVDVLRVDGAFAARARFPDEKWLYASTVEPLGDSGDALVTTVEAVARDGSFYFPGDPSLSLPAGMITVGFTAAAHLQSAGSAGGAPSAVLRGNLTFIDGGMRSDTGSWDPGAAAVERIARFRLGCGSGRPCDADERAAFDAVLAAAAAGDAELRFYAMTETIF